MKPVTCLRNLFLLFALAILYSSCADKTGGKIPFNEERARQQIIPLSQGSKYSMNFVHLRDSVLPGAIRDSSFLATRFNLPIGETFNRDAIASLLNAEGADGIRIYFGNDEKGQVRLVLMPVDKEGKDIITKLTNTLQDKAGAQVRTMSFSEGESVENGQRPPPPYNALSGN